MCYFCSLFEEDAENVNIYYKIYYAFFSLQGSCQLMKACLDDWANNVSVLLGVSYITANLYCICVTACFLFAQADIVQICGNIRSTL